jgi:K+-sensing histidine kinase KdpD
VTRLVRSDTRARLAGVAIGLVGVSILSAAMLPLRGHVANVFIALVLVIPVMIGAFAGGRAAGIVSAGLATLCFDYSFTVPVPLVAYLEP